MGSDKKTSFLDLIGPLFRRLSLVESRGGNLSLTNLAVMVCIVKIAIAPQISIPEIGALLLSLLNYGHKRFETNKVIKAELAAQSKVDQEHQAHLDAHSDAIKALQEQAKASEKVIEEAKSALVAQKLSASQQPRRQL